MEDNTKLIETLIEKATDYGKTSFELAKLKTLNKTSDIASSLIPHSIVFVFFASFLIFVNFGLAFWLGEILGNTYYGLFIIAAFYLIAALVLHFFFHKRIKTLIWNFIIKQALN
jgi:phosphoglycerol transferase MdoB-like AlkP superfamily enzyme